jgi:hypothetical protein
VDKFSLPTACLTLFDTACSIALRALISRIAPGTSHLCSRYRSSLQEEAKGCSKYVNVITPPLREQKFILCRKLEAGARHPIGPAEGSAKELAGKTGIWFYNS